MSAALHEDGPLLEVEGLRVSFATAAGRLQAVDGVSFRAEAGRVLCVVGESGSGKSVTAQAILRLVDAPGAVIAGRARYRGRDLLGLSEKEMEALRGDRISLIFQNPMTGLNPAFSVGEQIAEGVRLHERLGRRAATARAIELLAQVGIPHAPARYDDYPHRFSGGMRQRILIAGAIACRPDVLIADEPTTALDVSVQAQILKLLKALQEELGNALVLITHDLGVVATIADDVLVMYAGRVVEQAPVDVLFDKPLHPYTVGLLAAYDSGDGGFEPIPGQPPIPIDLPPGCAFRERCPRAADVCAAEAPPLRPVAPGHVVACHFAEGPPP